MTFDARTIAKVMGGDVNGDGALVPGPGHSPKDRSLSVKPDPAARDGFIVHSFAGDGVASAVTTLKTSSALLGSRYGNPTAPELGGVSLTLMTTSMSTGSCCSKPFATSPNVSANGVPMGAGVGPGILKVSVAFRIASPS